MKKATVSNKRKIIVGCLLAAVCAIVCIAAFMPSTANTHTQSEAAPAVTDNRISDEPQSEAAPVLTDDCISDEPQSEAAPALTDDCISDAQQPKTKTTNKHAYVDLGLSVKWATCNVGASSPEEYGDYFAWGEIAPKSEYTEENCKTYGKNLGDIAGNPQYDAARANWGNSWRLPTKAEWEELTQQCDWIWTTQNGQNGFKVMSKINGRSIFLPAAGSGHGASSQSGASEVGGCWSSTPHEDDLQVAYHLYFDCGYLFYVNSDAVRYIGKSIRPVVSATADPDMIFEDAPKENIEEVLQPATGTIAGHDYVDLGLSVKWAACNIGASSPAEYGDYFAWGETSTKSEYTEENCKTYGKDLGDISGNPQYDAARANWGGSWRLPTNVEMNELLDKCEWTWVRIDGHSGYKFTGVNGNSIFLPAAGFRHGSSLLYETEEGYYWCSTPFESDSQESKYKQYVYNLDFYCGYGACGAMDIRECGYCVRPVSE